MSTFSDILMNKIDETNNPTVVGLDPKLEYLPENMQKMYKDTPAKGILAFNKAIIDAICDIVPAVKPQLAYYEQYGVDGMIAFGETVRYSKEKGLIVIADAKRNDIGPTAEMYARGFFDVFGVDALTINAYLGIDGVKPFVDGYAERGKAVFALVKTSNPSSGQFQDILLSNGNRIFEAMSRLVEEWNAPFGGNYGPIGAVVGATYPEEAAILRKIMKHALFLVPGYGAQGGNADGAAACFDKNGRGAIVNSSRGILCAYKKDIYEKYGEDFASAARAEALRMKSNLNTAIAKYYK